MGASSYTPQRHVARMAELLLLWDCGSDVFKSESLRLRSSPPLPSSPSHDDAFAAGRASSLWSPSSEDWVSTRCGRFGDVLRVRVPKSVGKPDAVIPHVRFDERGLGNGRLPFGFAPRPPSLPAWMPVRELKLASIVHVVYRRHHG